MLGGQTGPVERSRNAHPQNPDTPTFQTLFCTQALVIGRLADSKPEVRNLASATLSGLIKVLHQHDTDALRASLQADAKRLFSRRVRKRAASDATTPAGSGTAVKGVADASLLEKQGCLQVR